MRFRKQFSYNSFDAYSASQLSKTGDLGMGSTVVLPGNGLAQLSIGDNDRWLSGDLFRWERGDDRFGQTGTIKEEGSRASRDVEPDEVRVFAERSLWVRDPDGNAYRMVEIEIARGEDNAGAHYYSFDSHHGLPEPGVELTVFKTANVFFGVKYDRLAIPEVVNRAPDAQDDTASTLAGQEVKIDVLMNDIDPDDDTLAIVDFEVTTQTGGSVELADKVFVYTPATGFVGTDTFKYSIGDGNGGTDTAIVSIKVESANQDPVAVDDTAETESGAAVTIDVLANDTDPDDTDVLSIDSFQALTTFGGTVGQDGQTLVYSSAAGFVGQDIFNYVISDGNGGTSEAMVTVNVFAAQSSITGTIFNDLDRDGVRAADEGVLPDVLVFIDSDNDGEVDDTERSTTTDETGVYVLDGLPPQGVVLRAIEPVGFSQSTDNPVTFELPAGQDRTGVDFGMFPAIILQSSGVESIPPSSDEWIW